MADLDSFDLEVLNWLALRDWPQDRVNDVVRVKLKAAGLIEVVDQKPGKPNYTRGKWFVRATAAGKKLLADRAFARAAGESG